MSKQCYDLNYNIYIIDPNQAFNNSAKPLRENIGETYDTPQLQNKTTFWGNKMKEKND